jgi:cob(I)alamin adenosyltransferase
MARQGQVQLYTGDGKGKSTAAAGQALRALGNGWRVLYVQFMKSVPSGEVTMLQTCGGENLTLLRKWDDSFIVGRASDKQIAMGRTLWQEAMEKTRTWRPDLLVLDEIAVAIRYGLVEEGEVLAFLAAKPDPLEVVLTGRDASEKLMEASTLVTEMRKVKHYYDAGVEARKGIEY